MEKITLICKIYKPWGEQRMKKSKLLLLGLLAVLIVSFITLPFTNIFAAGDGSTIAGVNVSGMKEKEIKRALNKAIKKWRSEPIVITDGNSRLEIDSAQIQFDVEGTISEYSNLVDKPWYEFWKKDRVVHISLHVMPNEEIKNEIAKFAAWKTDETYDQLINAVSFLKGPEIEPVTNDLSNYENERLSLVIEEIPNDLAGVKDLTDTLNNYVVNPDETFSLMEVIKEKLGNANSETLNFIASVLYSAVLETEYEIVEHHQQSSLPTYIDPGREAQVSMEHNEDLKFRNNSGHVGLIKMSIKDNKIKVEIYSDVKNKNVTVTIDEEYVKKRTITRYSREFAAGESKLIQSGEDGIRVVVYRTISGDGETKDERIGRSYYPPKNRIVVTSARSLTTSDDEGQDDEGQEDAGQADDHGQASDAKDSKDEKNADVKTEETLDDTSDSTTTEEDLLEDSYDEEDLPPGSYYDKSGNLITP